jgi:hypothetical protein
MVLNVICAGLLIGSTVDRFGEALQGGVSGSDAAEWELRLQSQRSDQDTPKGFGHFILQRTDEGSRLYFSVNEHTGLVTAGSRCELWYPKQDACFRGEPTDLPLTRKALTDTYQDIPRIHSWFGRVTSVLYLHPLITGWESRGKGWRWKIRMRGGQLLVGARANLVDADLSFRQGEFQWGIDLKSRKATSTLHRTLPRMSLQRRLIEVSHP